MLKTLSGSNPSLIGVTQRLCAFRAYLSEEDFLFLTIKYRVITYQKEYADLSHSL